MNNITPEIQELFNLLEKKSKLVAMVAPSFLVDFNYPEIVGMLKRLGFEYVVEVAKGAVETNKQLLALLEVHPNNRYIASPCPAIVRMIRNKYPDLVQFLAPIDSPMSATAKIVAKKYPSHKKVFIGPCFVKKIEAKEDYPELDILVLTFKEIKKAFEVNNIFFKGVSSRQAGRPNELAPLGTSLFCSPPQSGGVHKIIKNILPKKSAKSYSFDIVGSETRLYPISGGLAHSSGLNEKFTASECYIVSGPKLSEEALQKFLTEDSVKVLDIL